MYFAVDVEVFAGVDSFTGCAVGLDQYRATPVVPPEFAKLTIWPLSFKAEAAA